MLDMKRIREASAARQGDAENKANADRNAAKSANDQANANEEATAAALKNARALGADLKSGIEKIAAGSGGAIRSVAGMGLLLSLDLGTPEKAAQFMKLIGDAMALFQQRR